jgi:cystathionine beta-lyase/cystathionine gamma-synthase
MEDEQGLSTRCVHSGEIHDSEGSPHTTIYNATTFAFPSTKALLDVVDGRKPGSLYTRYGLNPTIRSLEAKLAEIERAESAIAFSSGMAAESALFLAYVRKGIVCIGDAYGGTLELLNSQLRSLSIPVHFLLGNELDKLQPLLEQGMDLVFFETPTNPVLEIFDIREISDIAHRHDALVCVDNTFATPVNQNPLLLGADIVVHSATKYLGGHSDITAGALMGSRRMLEPVLPWRKNLGQIIAPEVASLLLRSIRSLVLRVKRQNETATAVALRLSKHSKVKKVFYPGLENSRQTQLARLQMKGFGGMVTIELDGDTRETAAFVDKLRLFKIAPSLGGAESLVTQPITTTHHGLSEGELRRRGITGSMVRLSIGFEDEEDLITDLEKALA